MVLSLNLLCLLIIQASHLTLSAPVKDAELDTGATVVMPLQSRAPTSGGYLDLPAIANHIRAKHGWTTVDFQDDEESNSLQRRVNFNNIDLFDDGPDVSYFATIGVGTPPQKFSVILDTGSSDLLLSSSLCTSGCEDSVVYNPANSKTSQVQGQPVSLKFGSAEAAGELASDIVTLGGFRVNPQTFAMAKAVQGDVLNQHVHGLFGLGFQSLAKTGAVPFVQSLVNSKRFKDPVMSFYFQRHINDAKDDIAPGGTLTLGDVNPQFFNGSIEVHPVDVANFWAIGLEAITSQEASVTIPNTLHTAVIDTGATLIGAPSSVFKTLCQNLGGTQASGKLTGFCVIPCNLELNHLEVAFTFLGGQPWPIDPTDFVFLQPNGKNNPVCVTAIFDLTPSPGQGPALPYSWVVGLAFLKNVYTVFDFSPPSVGFAGLRSEIPPPPTKPPKTGGLRKRPPRPSATSQPNGSSSSLKTTGGSGGTGSTSKPKGSKFPCVNGKIFGIISC